MKKNKCNEIGCTVRPSGSNRNTGWCSKHKPSGQQAATALKKEAAASARRTAKYHRDQAAWEAAEDEYWENIAPATSPVFGGSEEFWENTESIPYVGLNFTGDKYALSFEDRILLPIESAIGNVHEQCPDGCIGGDWKNQAKKVQEYMWGQVMLDEMSCDTAERWAGDVAVAYHTGEIEFGKTIVYTEHGELDFLVKQKKV